MIMTSGELVTLMLVLRLGHGRRLQERGQDHEDDEQDQQHVREGRDVDGGHDVFFGAAIR